MIRADGSPHDPPRFADKGSNALVAALCAIIAAAALGIALVWTSLHRGPWYDEFYTWFVTRPDRPFMVALRESWLADNHPPLFDILAWAGGRAAQSIEQLRLLNLVALLSVLTGGWIVLRRLPQYWALGTLFVLILAANETALRSGAELRSYFLSLCAASVVVIAVTVGWLEGALSARGQRAVLWIALPIGFNLHILTSLVIGALLLPFLILAWLRGRRTLFRQMLTPSLVGGSVFLAVSMVQIPMWQANTARFWIPAGADAARWAIEYAVLRAAEANWLALIAGVAGAAVLLLADLRARRSSPALECMAVLGAGIALSAALLIGLHLLRPVVTERYLTALIPAVAMGIALGACAAMRSFPGRLGNAVMLGASALTLWSLVGNANRTAERKSWEGTSSGLEQLVRQCPDSPVHIDPPFWNAFALSLPPADNRMVIVRAYRLMARRHNFRIEPAASRRMSATCPTLFWAEHDTVGEWDAGKIAEHLRAQGFAVGRVWQTRIGDGWIASNRPLDLAPVAN